MRKLFIVAAIILPLCQALFSQSLQRLYPVSFSEVRINDAFWSPRMHTVATATLDACIDYTENKTGRIRNFEKAARRSKEKHEGIYYDDSDVYKALEAIAYSLRNHPSPKLEKKADEWIDKIAAAQLQDGYLNTYYTLTGLENRWTDMEKHEDYCAGHLIEAAIAYYNTTGKRKLLDVAVAFADHMDSIFRLGNRHWVSGHQEIELALMKLYHHTNKNAYLKLAEWFLEQRGHGYGRGVIWDQWKDPAYCQDLIPLTQQKEITGHAVRAMYLYTGAADVAAVTKAEGYVKAMHEIWEDVVYRNLYITGGIGALSKNEGFGNDYDLPNEEAYCETCASVGMVFWNQRMNWLTGDAKFIDVLEKSLYNAALDGLSLSGDRFFYGNPLASDGSHSRKEWFGTACCPSNIARLVTSLGNYIYATATNQIMVNLFVGSSAKLQVAGQEVEIEMETAYPWKGDVSLSVTPSGNASFTIALRLPGWLKAPAPGGLYHYRDGKKQQALIQINGESASYREENGYALINRHWRKGDRIDIRFPMTPRLVSARAEVKANREKCAIQYGPLVYCVEGKDNGDNAWNFILPPSPVFTARHRTDLLGGITTISFNATVMEAAKDGKTVVAVKKKLTAIPYYSWNNRGPGSMQVWLPLSIQSVKLNH